MEFSDHDLKCIFCRAFLEMLIQEQPSLQAQGFKHDLRFCEDCKSRPAWNPASPRTPPSTPTS